MFPLRQQVILGNAYAAFDDAGLLKASAAPDRQADAVLAELAEVTSRLNLVSV